MISFGIWSIFGEVICKNCDDLSRAKQIGRGAHDLISKRYYASFASSWCVKSYKVTLMSLCTNMDQDSDMKYPWQFFFLSMSDRTRQGWQLCVVFFFLLSFFWFCFVFLFFFNLFIYFFFFEVLIGPVYFKHWTRLKSCCGWFC